LLFGILCINFYKGCFYSCQINEDTLSSMPANVLE
jgi:hypothetical protein